MTKGLSIRGPKTSATLSDTGIVFTHPRDTTFVPLDAVRSVSITRRGTRPCENYQLTVTTAGGDELRTLKGGMRDGVTFNPRSVVVKRKQREALEAFAAEIQRAIHENGSHALD